MMTKRIISGILSFAVMLSALTIFADNNADIKNTSSIIAQAYVDDNGQVVSNNMKVYTGDFGLNAFSIKGGKKGWLFDILSSKTDNYLYMDIDDKLLDVRDKGRIIKVSVDYFDAGTSSFAIEYTNREGKQVETPYKEFEGSLKWKTHTFTIMDAFLTNGVNGADLRLSSKTKNMQTSLENFTVSKVSVEITNTFNQVNVKAETQSYGNHFFTGEEIDFKYTLDNSKYAFESHTKGPYTLNAKFYAKSIEGETVFEKEDTITLYPGKKATYDLKIDVGGRYGVYFITAQFENKEKGIYAEDTTRFSYTYTTFGETINYAFGTCSARRTEFAHLFENAGIGKVRTMQSYTNVVSSDVDAKQAFYFPASGFSLQRAIRERDISTFNTLISISGDFVEGEQAPYTEEGFKNFFNYANYVLDVERYGVESYDMWNEWDLMGASFNRYARPIEDYVEFMKRTYTELKTKYPDLKFWGGVSSTVNISWLKKILELGGGDYMDGYCVHAYKIQYDPMSGGAVELVAELRKLLDEYGYYDVPIVTTELGYVDDTYYDIDELKQGYYLVEYYVALKKVRNFKEYVMYIFQDNGITKGSRENHWGLVEFTGAKTQGAAKASYPMVATLNNMLAGYEYKDEITANDDAYAYRMHNAEKNDDVIFLWARGNGGTISMDLGCDKVEMYDCYGNMSYLYGKNGVFTFALNEAPIYVKGDMKKFEKSEQNLIDRNDFNIEFAQDVNFKIEGIENKDLNIEITPRDNKDLKFEITKNEDGSYNVFADTNRSKSLRDIAYIKIYDDDKKHLDGYLVFEYKTPVTLDMVCTPNKLADGKFDYTNTNLIISITNNASEALNGKFLINDIVGVSNYKNSYEGMSIPSGATDDIIMNVSSDISQFKMDASFITDDGTSVDFTDTTSYGMCEYAYTKPTIDGVVSAGEYSSKTFLGVDNVISLHAVDFYLGNDDYSANASFAWDEENLYIAMECIDDKLYNESPASSSMWRYDSFQFAACYDPYEKYEPDQMVSVVYGVTGGKNTLEMVVNKALKKMNDPKNGFEGAIKRNETSTVYEVKVPWQTILMEEMEVLPDTVLKISVLANDNDGLGRKAAVQYGEGIYSGSKSTDMFIKMYLKKGEQ